MAEERRGGKKGKGVKGNQNPDLNIDWSLIDFGIDWLLLDRILNAEQTATGNIKRGLKMRAYRREDGGQLELCTLHFFNGRLDVDANTPLNPTGERVMLKGWPDTAAKVYKTAAGTEYLVPEDATK